MCSIVVTGMCCLGLWYDLGPHLLDQAVCLFGMPDTVSAEMTAVRDDANGVVDLAIVILGWTKPGERLRVVLR